MAGELTDLPSDARSILLAIPADGSTIGNGRLRDTVGLDPDRYSELTSALKTLGLVAAGRGRGGSLALTVEGQRVRKELSGGAEAIAEPQMTHGTSDVEAAPSS